MIQKFTRWVALLSVAMLAACGGSDDDRNLVELAKADPQFSILVEAVVAADLTGTLSGPGPYTLFAPTNDAFASLLAELGVTKEALLANKPLLTAVLTYHVLPGRVLKDQIPLGKALTTVQGGVFKIDASGSSLVITDGRNRRSGITKANLIVSNGVIHVIDKVLLPADKTIVATAVATPSLSVLVEAVTAAGLVDTLNGTGAFTVFAPTDAAFANLLTYLGLTKEQLLADTALLTKVLTYHVVPGRVLKADVPVGQPITTVEGETFTVNSALAITDKRGRSSAITATDIFTSNGVVHLIDTVILPAP